ncbi:hypothetical protein [Helicobacter sp. MIT 05-5294]|uniref:hypothetical protein n=1 Tax=Helicobacter sp. MIT 05-5294 TaxID=1548150 RepID=UPI00051F9546|nr:hypothetical protein [Helicobacter sp. MIT 05-5294]TLD85594.1 hypothetical protein LS69_008770 [Helicobacter sp. MIT 05-5294]
MNGFLVGLNAQTKRGLIEQAHNKRRFEFDLRVWDGDFKEISPNMEVEFELSENAKQVSVVRPKKNLKEEFVIHQTKSIKDCIYDYFGGTENLIKRYEKEIKSNKDLDFLRIKRFLFTAYNDLFELDSTIPNMALSNLKSELGKLDKEYESFIKKSSYPPQYSYEKIFLARQIEFVKNEELIQTTQSIIKSAAIQQASMGQALKNMENQFAARNDTGSASYLQAQNNLKSFRKRYVDLLHYLSQQKEKLAKITKAGEEFSDKFFEPFLKNYLPLTKELKQDFIKLLNAKAFDLDRLLWQRAKRSLSVRRFFIEAGITGTYSSKTFLKYFLRSLDRNKIRNETKGLFDLLKYLEAFSKKNILLIQEDPKDSKYYKEYLKNFDSDLQITTSNDPRDNLRLSNPVELHVIVMEWEVKEMNILNFRQKYLEMFKDSVGTPVFCAIISKGMEEEVLQNAKQEGISYFIIKGNTDQFIDMMRMIL